MYVFVHVRTTCIVYIFKHANIYNLPHCIRPTVVTAMWNAGCSVQDTQVVTGHKKEDSVKQCSKRVDDVQKEEYSRISARSFNDSILSSETTDKQEEKIRRHVQDF